MLKFDEIAKMQEVRTGLVESDLQQAIRWQVRHNSDCCLYRKLLISSIRLPLQ